MSPRTSTVTLLVSVLVTAAAVSLYILEPKLPGSEQRVDTAAPGEAPPEHRIAAIDADGHVLQIDDRTGAVAERLDVAVDPSAGRDRLAVERVENGLSAYVARPGATDEIDLVHLDTGGTERFATGSHPALSPDEDALAYVRVVDGRTHLFVQNTTTGREQDRGVAAVSDLEDVRALAWTGDGGQIVVLTSSSAHPLWQVGRDRDLDAATALDGVVPAGGVIDAVTSYENGVAIAQRANGRTSIVWVKAGLPGGKSTLTEIEGTVSSLNAPPSHDALLIVRDETLFRWAGEGAPEHLSDGVLAAAW